MDKIEDIDLGKISDIAVSHETHKDCLLEVSSVDGFREYLKETMAADIKRYFFSSQEQQPIIKGAFHRTKYLYDILKKVSDENINKA